MTITTNIPHGRAALDRTDVCVLTHLKHRLWQVRNLDTQEVSFIRGEVLRDLLNVEMDKGTIIIADEGNRGEPYLRTREVDDLMEHERAASGMRGMIYLPGGIELIRISEEGEPETIRFSLHVIETEALLPC